MKSAIAGTWRPLALLAGIVLALICGAAVLAHADAGGAPAAPDPLSWMVYVGIAIGAAGGLVKVLEVLLAGLTWLAPRTKTTIDDTLRDDVKILRDDVQAVLKVVGGLVPATGVPVPAQAPAVAPLAVVKPGAGAAGMLAVLLLGLAGGATLTSCGGSQSSRAATIGSVDSGVRAVVAALRTYEHDKAEAAIAGAKTLDDGKAALAALRAKTAPAWKAVDDALVALDTANTINDDPSVKTAATALSTAVALVAALTGGTP